MGGCIRGDTHRGMDAGGCKRRDENRGMHKEGMNTRGCTKWM